MQKQKGRFKEFLEGKRIYLRKVRAADAAGNYRRWMNDPEVIRYLESRFAPLSEDSLETYIRREEGNATTVFMAIVEKRSEEHIGNIKIHGIDRVHSHAQVSLIIGEKQHWGKGYGTEAIRLIVDFAFNTLNLHKLFACIYAPNGGSIAAFRKAGFVEEGLRKQHRFFNGCYVDEVDMAFIKPMRGEGQW